MSDLNILEYLSKWVDPKIRSIDESVGWDDHREVLFEEGFDNYIAACVYLDIGKSKYVYCVWEYKGGSILIMGETKSLDVAKFISTVEYMRSRNKLVR